VVVEVSGPTLWRIALDVLVLKLVSPEYDAVIVWIATERADVVRVAAPPPDSAPLPMLTPPSRKVTVPVGVPEPGDLTPTSAVKVTDWPNTVGFVPDETTVPVVASRTVCPPAKLPMLGRKIESPLYDP
jgi:hypothetical protein